MPQPASNPGAQELARALNSEIQRIRRRGSGIAILGVLFAERSGKRFKDCLTALENRLAKVALACDTAGWLTPASPLFLFPSLDRETAKALAKGLQTDIQAASQEKRILRVLDKPFFSIVLAFLSESACSGGSALARQSSGKEQDGEKWLARLGQEMANLPLDAGIHTLTLKDTARRPSTVVGADEKRFLFSGSSRAPVRKKG